MLPEVGQSYEYVGPPMAEDINTWCPTKMLTLAAWMDEQIPKAIFLFLDGNPPRSVHMWTLHLATWNDVWRKCA